jgi:hypothetical protein
VSLARRKLTLQLTPLLDMLLIVFFLQYMEMREDVGRVAGNTSQLQTQLGTSQAEVDRLRVELAEARATSQQALAREQADRAAADRNLITAIERQQLLGRLMVDLFNIPPDVVDKLLNPERLPPAIESSEEYARIREEFRDRAAATPGDMVRHLLTFSEVRKQCDIWELHLDAQARELRLEVNGTERQLPLPLEGGDNFASLDQPAFEHALYMLLKTMPQPKGLVFVTLTYDYALRANLFEPARLGIEHVVDRLRAEAAGRSQFEFADLGIAAP